MSRLLPQVDQPVDLSFDINLGSSPLALSQAQAAIRGPDGRLQTLPLAIEGTQARVSWKPTAAGLYAIDVSARGLRPDGATVERTAFLSVEAQPAASIAPGLWLGSVLLLIIVGAMLAWWMARRRRQSAAS